MIAVMMDSNAKLILFYASGQGVAALQQIQCSKRYTGEYSITLNTLRSLRPLRLKTRTLPPTKPPPAAIITHQKTECIRSASVRSAFKVNMKSLEKIETLKETAWDADCRP